MLLLASTSAARLQMMKSLMIDFEVRRPTIDESALQRGLQAEAVKPRDLVDALAEAKARSVSLMEPEALVIGADQILVHRGAVVHKAKTLREAEETLKQLSGETHQLLSAVVLARGGQALWRALDHGDLTMRALSPGDIAAHLDRWGEALLASVGCYRIEVDRDHLFETVRGDTHTIMGLPLAALKDYLVRIGYPCA